MCVSMLEESMGVIVGNDCTTCTRIDPIFPFRNNFFPNVRETNGFDVSFLYKNSGDSEILFIKVKHFVGN